MTLRDVTMTPMPGGDVRLSFVQAFEADGEKETLTKGMVMTSINGRWQISAEVSSPVIKHDISPTIYTLQMGIFAEAKAAEALVSELRAAGHEPFIVSEEITPNRYWHSVRLGRYSDKSQAKLARMEITHDSPWKQAIITPMKELKASTPSNPQPGDERPSADATPPTPDLSLPAPGSDARHIGSPETPVQTTDLEQVRQTLYQWAEAWSQRDIARYESFYAKAFDPKDRGGRDPWRQRHARNMKRCQFIEVGLEHVKLEQLSKHVVTVHFQQHYHSDRYQDRSHRRMMLVREADAWRIVAEFSAPADEQGALSSAANLRFWQHQHKGLLEALEGNGNVP